jgi:hypothetical protein
MRSWIHGLSGSGSRSGKRLAAYPGHTLRQSCHACQEDRTHISNVDTANNSIISDSLMRMAVLCPKRESNPRSVGLHEIFHRIPQTMNSTFAVAVTITITITITIVTATANSNRIGKLWSRRLDYIVFIFFGCWP